VKGTDLKPIPPALNKTVLLSTMTAQLVSETALPTAQQAIANATSGKKEESGKERQFEVGQSQGKDNAFTLTPSFQASAAAPATDGRGAQPAAAPAPAAHGTPTVADQVAVETTRQAQLIRRGEATELSLRLNPPELGTVQVHLRATESGLSARFVVADEGARQALEGQMQALRTRLSGAGVSLGSFDVFQGQQGTHPGWQWPAAQPQARTGTPAPKSVPVWLQSVPVGVDRVDVVA
jgi:flagellar hook-length control protein FliK